MCRGILSVRGGFFSFLFLGGGFVCCEGYRDDGPIATWSHTHIHTYPCAGLNGDRASSIRLIRGIHPRVESGLPPIRKESACAVREDDSATALFTRLVPSCLCVLINYLRGFRCIERHACMIHAETFDCPPPLP